MSRLGLIVSFIYGHAAKVTAIMDPEKANDEAAAGAKDESFKANDIIALITNASKDAVETKDFLSYSTLLDIYLGDPTKFKNSEREELLDALLAVLSSSDELVHEIGWDIPQLLLPYVESSDADLSGPIRSLPGVYKTLKIFEVLALKGNPKELFLKCCELLTTIKIEDIASTDDINEKIQFFEVKLYCIFELVDASLKKIKTFYPSRFLSMAVTSFINMVYQNNIDSSHLIQFILRRAYSFARNYNSLPLPDDVSSVTNEELAKLTSDEEYLQQKLLTAFITQAVQVAMKNYYFGYSNDHFSYLQSLIDNKKQGYTSDVPALDRLGELALSFDLDLTQIFKDYVSHGDKLLNSVDLNQLDDDVSGEIFEKIIIDYQKVVLTTIIDQKVEKINNSTIGSVIIFMHKIAVSRKFDQIDICFKDALSITLRSIVPQMIQHSFILEVMIDISIFVSWYSLHQLQLKGESPELAIANIPKQHLTVYYQALLHTIIFCDSRKNFRFIVITLLTKVLASSPESITYPFIIDSLKSCPFDKVIAVLVGIFKELLIKSKPQPKEIQKSIDNDLADKLNKVKLDNKSKPPPLPRRDTQISERYITLDQERFEHLADLISNSIDSTFVEDGSEISINPVKLSTLTAYLNLLVVMKNNAIVVKNIDLLNGLVEKVENSIKSIKSKEDNPNVFEGNAADMLTITIDRIKSA